MFSAALLFLLLIHGAHCVVPEIDGGRKMALSPHCVSNPPTLDPASGAGHVEKLADFNTYVSGSLESKLAVLLASDVYGYETPNLRKIADKVAAAGFYAVVPDFFYGEPFNPNRTDRPKDAWLKDHSPEKGFKDAKLMVQALKSKGVSKIGAAGFCWGAKAVIELAKIADVQAAVILHPSFVTVDDIKGVKVPLAILSAELDKKYPPELLKQFDEILQLNKVDRFVKMFPKCSHGWTLRYNVSDPAAVSRADEAHQDMLNWFTKHIK
ncbi:Alpha/beta-Hydrolases superfamily protein isoform 3 [Hibiscus syriacus]|uniref:Alpha/beta-Hydrolases superfamily protein isoform 3 n=1 Tax=Hibiscus syriacus TaxID=106335 RepID=A0A6A3BHR6_HIBSY|nr:endo-1,3;1,4-beta-D-glucanase-like [Hibiscus syriacus]KAE8714572.1 Alpha/beta-Hydrolases superfamily protein isoform 3 [Hibiscus syriacus]